MYNLYKYMQTFRFKKSGVASLTQAFSLEDPMIRVQRLNFRSNGYADYVFVLPYTKNKFQSMCALDNCFPFCLDKKQMICYLKNIIFLGISPENIHADIDWCLPKYYLECTRTVQGLMNVKEVYRLDKFVGYGFEVLKARYKDPFTDKDNFSISKETIDLITLFKNQEDIDFAESNALYTSFIDESFFVDCYEYILKQLSY